MNSNIKCMCGNNLELYNDMFLCNICSTKYDSKGRLLLSRHNWNVKDYFCAFQKSQLNPDVKHQN